MLAEVEPWFGIAGGSDKAFLARRTERLRDPVAARAYLRELELATGAGTLIGDPLLRPDLRGAQLNLYMAFMCETWRHSAKTGVVGLLHPDGHMSEPKAALLRRATYPRLRRHWHFVNEANLFEEVGHPVPFTINVYGPTSAIKFRAISRAQIPSTIDGSVVHDGRGPVPGVKTIDGEWDRRPHAERVITVDEVALRGFASLYDPPGTSAAEARLVRPYTRADVAALGSLAKQPRRIGSTRYHWSDAWHEKQAKTDGIIEWRTEIPTSWDEVVLQGPHIAVCNPFAKQPNEHCRSKGDWSAWDLETLPDRVVPRTNYQRACSRDRYRSESPHWDGRPATDQLRLLHRRMAGQTGARSLQAAVVRPGPLHVHTCHTFAHGELRATVLTVGLWASLPMDFMFKVSGKGDVQDELVQRFPSPRPAPADTAVLLRTLRMNCLTADYGPLWSELCDRGEFAYDGWTTHDTRLPPLATTAPGSDLRK